MTLNRKLEIICEQLTDFNQRQDVVSALKMIVDQATTIAHLTQENAELKMAKLNLIGMTNIMKNQIDEKNKELAQLQLDNARMREALEDIVNAASLQAHDIANKALAYGVPKKSEVN